MDNPRHRVPLLALIMALVFCVHPVRAQELAEALKDLGHSLVDEAGCKSDVKTKGKEGQPRTFAVMTYKGASYNVAVEPSADGGQETVLRYSYLWTLESDRLKSELNYDYAIPLSQVEATRSRVTVMEDIEQRDQKIFFEPAVYTCVIAFKQPLQVPLRTVKTLKGEQPSEVKSTTEQRFVGVMFAKKEDAEQCLARLKKVIELGVKQS